MYEVIYTGQFKRSLRLCVRRGLDINAFPVYLTFYKKMEYYHQSTAHTSYKASTKGVGNATYSPTGCSSGNKKTPSFASY